MQTSKFQSSLSRFVLFLVDFGFLLVNNGEQFKFFETKGYIFKRNKEELSRGNNNVFMVKVILRNPCSINRFGPYVVII